MIDPSITQRAEHALTEACGYPFEKLLAPIDGVTGTGRAATNGGIAQAIRQSRAADDVSLPMGALERQLRRADWEKVMRIACDALANHGKDLQVAAWLLEAQIHRRGFATIPGCLHLLVQLCDRYWDDIHPYAQSASYGLRSNVFSWVDRKLAPILRQVPLAFDRQGEAFCLSDWERARRIELQRQSDPDGVPEGPGSADLSAALAALRGEACADAERDLADAQAILKQLSTMLDEKMGEEAPVFNIFGAVLEQARGLFEAELQRRGLSRHVRPGDAAAAPVAVAPAAVQQDAAASGPTCAIIRDRAQAYALLEQAAAFLLQVEPHSPVPYVVRQAAQWGQLSAAELYQELFLRNGGQVHIFEIMGVAAPAPADA